MLIHRSRRISSPVLLSSFRGSPPLPADTLLFGCLWYQWTLVFPVNLLEMQRVCKLLAKWPRASKLSRGKWSCTAANPMPSWECVQRAPLWTDEEWADLHWPGKAKNQWLALRMGRNRQLSGSTSLRMEQKHTELGQRQLQSLMARQFRMQSH